MQPHGRWPHGDTRGRARARGRGHAGEGMGGAQHNPVPPCLPPSRTDSALQGHVCPQLSCCRSSHFSPPHPRWTPPCHRFLLNFVRCSCLFSLNFWICALLVDFPMALHSGSWQTIPHFLQEAAHLLCALPVGVSSHPSAAPAALPTANRSQMSKSCTWPCHEGATPQGLAPRAPLVSPASQRHLFNSTLEM